MENTTKNQLNEEDGAQPKPKQKRSRVKPKVCCEWDKADVFQLIECVKQYPCLWNYSSVDHKNLNVRALSWRKIEAQLGNRYTVNDCKAKWTNVKTAFQRTKVNFSKNNSGHSDAQPHWPYWSVMQFADSYESPNKTTFESDLTFETFENEQFPVDNNLLESGPTDDSTSQSAIAPETLQATGRYNAPLRRKFEARHPNNALESSANKSMEHGAQVLDALDTKGEEDEWQVIANYWALQLRTLAERDPGCANRTHFEVSKVILEASFNATVQPVVAARYTNTEQQLQSFEYSETQSDSASKSNDSQSNIAAEYNEQTTTSVDKTVLPSSTEVPHTSTNTDFKNPKPPKRFKRSAEASLYKALGELKAISETLNQHSQDDDEIDCFVKSMASKLKKLPEAAAQDSMGFIMVYLVQQRLKTM